jgi:hypothetical protein
MKVSFTSKGDFKRTQTFLSKMAKGDLFRNLNGLAQSGVAALSSATPRDSGETAAMWSADVKISSRYATIVWKNGHVVNGVPIAIILQYGHGTGTGGYVQGRDYINPAIKPVMDQLADQAWKAVVSA